MENSAYFQHLFLTTLIISISCHATGLGDRQWYGWTPVAKPGCNDSIGECMVGGEFDVIDTEISRRILATNDYISYGALVRNSVPCSQRGASYYNCQPGAEANPYSRGCSAITRCRG